MLIKDTRKLPFLIRISILANSTTSKSPEFNVVYDNNSIEHTGVEVVDNLQSRYLYEFETTKLSNISISLLNKEYGDTKLDNDVIVEDLYIKVDNFSVDQIDLTNKINPISSYINEHNVSQTYGFLGFNGTMTLKIHHNLLYTDVVVSTLTNN